MKFIIVVLSIIYNRVAYIKRIKGYNETLYQREQTLHLALWGSDAGTWQWDHQDNLVTVNQIDAASAVSVDLQFDEDRWLDKVQPQQKQAVLTRWHQYIAQPDGAYKDEYKMQVNNKNRWIRLSGKVVSTDQSGRAEKIVGTFSDITEQKSLEKQRLLFGQAFESASDGIIILDQSERIQGVNPSICRISGFTQADLLQMPIKALFADSTVNGVEQVLAATQSLGNWQGESKLINQQQLSCPVWLNVTQMDRDNANSSTDDNDEKHYLILITDISESKKADRALRQLTNYDVLTGLPNRKLFEEHLAFSIAHAKSSGQQLALLFVDLVRFKAINDRFGHNIGDAVLNKAGQRMLMALNDKDMIARFGGDKFVVLLNSLQSANNPNRSCCALLSAFDLPVEANNKEFHLSVTIGVTLWPDDDATGEQLIKHAEMAMYHAKEGGRSNFEYFCVNRQQKELSRLKLEHELSQALEKKQFSLYYQPQVDAKTNRIIGVEALIRWHHPLEGFISPEQFIPIAEATGLIIPISDWVLQTAIETALSWQSQLPEPIKMAVNISGLHFNEPSFAYSIIMLLDKYELDPKDLCLEITEGMLISDIEQPLAALQQLRKIGVQVAIDDFGTGYSSLAYLKQFPVTCLKIDKSFVLNLSQDQDDQAIVNSVVSLGHFLGFEVLAEGVETLADYQLLQQIGCDQVQGYYFAKPQPADEALAFIQGFVFEPEV